MYNYYYNHFMAPWTVSRTTQMSRYQKGESRKVKPIWIYLHRPSLIHSCLKTRLFHRSFRTWAAFCAVLMPSHTGNLLCSTAVAFSSFLIFFVFILMVPVFQQLHHAVLYRIASYCSHFVCRLHLQYITCQHLLCQLTYSMELMIIWLTQR